MATNVEETSGKLIWFLLITVAVATYVVADTGYALMVAGGLWFILSLATILASRAIHCLGVRAWWLLAQLVACFAVFIWLAPWPGMRSVLIVWGIGLPLAFLGAILRRVRESRTGVDVGKFDIVMYYCVLVAASVIAHCLWQVPFGFWTGVGLAWCITALAMIPLYYGWRLAAREPRGERDAKFGTLDRFRDAGISDER